MKEDGDLETPGWRACHFCAWKIRVTEVDRVIDVKTAYGVHILRHGEAMTPIDLDKAIFDELIEANDL